MKLEWQRQVVSIIGTVVPSLVRAAVSEIFSGDDAEQFERINALERRVTALEGKKTKKDPTKSAEERAAEVE